MCKPETVIYCSYLMYKYKELRCQLVNDNGVTFFKTGIKKLSIFFQTKAYRKHFFSVSVLYHLTCLKLEITFKIRFKNCYIKIYHFDGNNWFFDSI